MNLRELETRGFLDADSAGEEAIALLERDRAAETKLPWIARAALGIGAWLSGIFFTGFVFLLFDLDDGLPTSIIGFLMATGSVFLLRRGKGIFLDQLALSLGLAGHLLFFFGLHDVHSNDLVGPFIGALILCGPVYWFSKNSVQRFLSVLWVWMLGWIVGMDDWRHSFDIMPYLMFFAALAAALAILGGWEKATGRTWRPAMWASVIGLFGMLSWLSVGDSWEFGDQGSSRAFGLGGAMAISGVLWHLARPEGRAGVGFGALVVLLIVLGIAGAPGVVAGLGLMAIARARKDRHLEWVSIVALAHFLIAFYYHLEISLMQKSIILMATGVIFLGLRLWLFRSVGGVGTEKKGEELGRTSRLIQVVVIVANCLLVLAVVNGAIIKKQRIVDTGRTLFLQLAPVDPRSLMQGDYMALRYALARDQKFLSAAEEDTSTRGKLVVKLDEKNIATFSRIADAETSPGEDEALLKYRKWRHGWRFGIESFFFQEGLGDIYAAAKFAELRVAPDGKTVLVDLVGASLEPLTSGIQPDDESPGADSENP